MSYGELSEEVVARLGLAELQKLSHDEALAQAHTFLGVHRVQVWYNTSVGERDPFATAILKASSRCVERDSVQSITVTPQKLPKDATGYLIGSYDSHHPDEPAYHSKDTVSWDSFSIVFLRGQDEGRETRQS